MGTAYFLIDHEILQRVMRFPLGVRIVGISLPPSRPDAIIIYIEHPDLPHVKEGEMIPCLEPSVTLTPSNTIWHWGIDNEKGEE